MGQVSVLSYALSDIDLRLETIDASIGCIWVSHDTADATSDLLGSEELLICHLDTAMLISTRNSDVVLITCGVKVKCVVVSIDFWFEQHVICVLFLFLVVLLVNLHVFY